MSNGGFYTCTECDERYDSDRTEELALNGWACLKCGGRLQHQMSEAKVCDFCSSPDPEWAYDCATFMAPRGPKDIPLLPDQNMIGAWAACTPCADLIDAYDRPGLRQRSATRFRENYPSMVGTQMEAQIEGWHAHLYDSFFINKMSDRIPAEAWDDYMRERRSQGISPVELGPIRGGRKAPWSEALHIRTELVGWWVSGIGMHFAHGFIKDVTERKKEMDPLSLMDSKEWAANESRRLAQADLYWVEEEMERLVDNAAKTMPPVGLVPAELPSEAGFAVFERSIQIKDSHGKIMSVRGVLWGPGTDQHGGNAGLALSFYTDNREPDDYKEQMEGVMTALPALTLSHFFLWPWGETADRYHDQPLGHENSWSRRFLQAFWHIVQQPIVTALPHEADRPTRRAAMRGKGMKMEEVPTVMLITLRKARQKLESGEMVSTPRDWSHRWVVAGHWRQRRYKDGVRPKYIHEYIKGPEDKPLVIKERLYRFVR